jgi:hypothetical protein
MLTRAYAIQGGVAAEIQLDSVKHIVKGIRGDVKVALAEIEARFGLSALDPKPTIIETVRSHGYRIGNMSVVVIDHIDERSMSPELDTGMTTSTIPK